MAVNCWHCERPAQGVCRFCGRGLCRDHVQSLPYILTTFLSQNKVKAIVVGDTLYCGLCKPVEDPVDLLDAD